MKSLGWLTGCALALACAHEGKSVVGERDTKMQATAAEASQPSANSRADASSSIRAFHVDVPEKARSPAGGAARSFGGEMTPQ